MHKIKLLVALTVGFTAALGAMRRPLPAKQTDEDQFVGAAGAGNIKGINYWLFTEIPEKGKRKFSVNTQSSLVTIHGRVMGEVTPLEAAARTGQLEAVQLLLKNGANPNIPDVEGLTPLAWAVIQLNRDKPGMPEKYEAIVKLLVASGADVHARAGNGVTVLHQAAGGGNPAIVRYLLANGAFSDINAEGSKDKGRTP